MGLLCGHLLAASSHGQVLHVAALLQDTTPTALPWTSLGAQAMVEGSIPWQEKVTQSKSICSCVIQTNLRPPPTTVPAEPGGISPQPRRLSHHTPPSWLHHIPQSTGMGRRGALHGCARSHHIPEGQLSQPYLVTWHTPSLSLLCRDGDRCSEQSSTAPLASGTQSPCP